MIYRILPSIQNNPDKLSKYLRSRWTNFTLFLLAFEGFVESAEI